MYMCVYFEREEGLNRGWGETEVAADGQAAAGKSRGVKLERRAGIACALGKLFEGFPLTRIGSILDLNQLLVRLANARQVSERNQ